MKTYRFTLNRYFLSCTLVLAATLWVMLLEPLAPQRNLVCKLLGIENAQLWFLAAPACLIVLITLSIRLQKQLVSPIQALSEQCSLGNVPPQHSKLQQRETRIIRNFIRQTQERANSRATQISQMEAELIATRKTGDRKIRKIEELEDLLASYERIRNELSHDNGSLRQEIRSQSDRIKLLERQLAKIDRESAFLANR